MKLSEALSRMNGAAEKTASVATPSSPAPTQSNDVTERLKVALKEATAPDVQKTASAASPVEDLTKIAADLSKAEHDALVKEAQLFGAAVCDGFMARAAQYNEASAKVAAVQPGLPLSAAYGEKTASEASFEKFAAENPVLVKDAAQLGYDTTVSQLEKLASSAYEKGYNDTVQQIHKHACDSFVAGFNDTLSIIEGAR